MHPQALLVFLSALAITSASPVGRRCKRNDTAVTPTLPVNGGATELPSPGDATLKHIVVGHGIQNYTCAAADATATSSGALAVLYEITSLFPGSGADSLPEAEWTALPSKVLRNTAIPLNLLPGASVAAVSGADPDAPFPAPPVDLTMDGLAAPLRFLGHHYFDSANVPTFDLSGSSTTEVLKAKKDNGTAAPATADRGLADEGAVDWLKLSDKGGSVGLTMVYRVTTAGGSPSACTAEGQTESVPYTAMYWLY